VIQSRSRIFLPHPTGELGRLTLRCEVGAVESIRQETVLARASGVPE
jgi:hypothetical protein